MINSFVISNVLNVTLGLWKPSLEKSRGSFNCQGVSQDWNFIGLEFLT